MRSELKVTINIAQKKKEIYPVTLNILVQNLDISLSVMQKIPIMPIITTYHITSNIVSLQVHDAGAKSK